VPRAKRVISNQLAQCFAGKEAVSKALGTGLAKAGGRVERRTFMQKQERKILKNDCA
jgi:phosphopantetheinyl transferase (holo-ACP synthase)